MKIRRLFLVIISLIVIVLIWFYFKAKTEYEKSYQMQEKSEFVEISESKLNNSVVANTTNSISKQNNKKEILEMVVAVVACGMRLQETLNMLKSVIMFNVERIPVKFVIVAEESLYDGFKEKLDDWMELTKNLFTYEILPLTFPEKDKNEWKTLFKPCAAQRLFLPSLLKHIDSVLYLDTDTLLLSPVNEIWNLFEKFNKTQMAGLSPEHENSNVGWYNRFARHPFYGPLGVNSGVMLMNLTRMRKFRWEEYMLPLYKEFKLKITWGDQDIINILFFYHPDKLYVFPCEWNYRPDHCMYMSVCNTINCIKILHGNRGYFHNDKQPIFSIAYKTIEEYQLGTDVYRNFLQPFEIALTDDSVMNSNCGQIIDKLLFCPKKLFKESVYYYDSTR